MDGEIWVETAILTHNNFSWPYYAVLSLRPHLAFLLVLGWEVLSDWLGLFWPRDCLPVSQIGICIYHFITPTHFQSTMWLLPLIFTDASCAENLWLTARSRVNMQQTGIWRQRIQSLYLCLHICPTIYTHSWKENRWFHVFLKGIRVKKTASSTIWTLVSDSIVTDNNIYTKNPKVNVFTQSFNHGKDITWGQFLSKVNLVWIQFSFS